MTTYVIRDVLIQQLYIKKSYIYITDAEVGVYRASEVKMLWDEDLTNWINSIFPKYCLFSGFKPLVLSQTYIIIICILCTSRLKLPAKSCLSHFSRRGIIADAFEISQIFWGEMAQKRKPNLQQSNSNILRGTLCRDVSLSQGGTDT